MTRRVASVGDMVEVIAPAHRVGDLGMVVHVATVDGDDVCTVWFRESEPSLRCSAVFGVNLKFVEAA